MAEAGGGVTIRTLSGDAIGDVLDDVARLRIVVFRDWPYLYDGDMDYERQYLAKFAASKGAVVIGAFDGETMVGASTAAPLGDHFEEFFEPFENAGFIPAEFFYFAESVLLQSWRGKGIGVRFFEEREKAARDQGYAKATFCGVVRPADHPMRPADHVPLDGFWRNRGYEPVPGLVCTFSWRDIGERTETEKQLQFWSKTLD